MLPDVLGYRLEDALEILKNSGIDIEELIIKDYAPKIIDTIGNDKRIIRIDEKNGKNSFIVSSF